MIEAAKTGCTDLADLAAAVEQDVSTGAGIHNLRRIERAVRAIKAHGVSDIDIAILIRISEAVENRI